MDSKAIGSAYSASLRATSGTKADGAQASKATASSDISVSQKRPDVRLESLDMARTIASDGAPVDMAKVADIQMRISEGRYEVDSSKIAEAMIRMDLM